MLSLVLAATLASTPAPRAATAAETIVHIPRLDRLEGVSAFLERAGQHAALLRPAAWRDELHPFLRLDPSRPDTLAAAGIDASGPLTVSVRRDGRVSCTRLTDPAAFQARAAAELIPAGNVAPTTTRGVTVLSAPRTLDGRAGYALKGREACAFLAPGGSEGPQKEAARLVARAPAPDARLARLPGALFLLQPGRGAVAGLEASVTELRLTGTSSGLPLPPFQEAGASPYGAMKPSGLLFSRARVAPAGLSQAVGSLRAQLQQVCPACPSSGVASVMREVSGHLTGHLLLQLDDVKVRGSLRTPEGRFFSVRQALAAEVKDAGAVKAALAPLGQFPGARALEDGYALAVKGGTLLVRLRGRHLLLGNDEAVLRGLASALPSQAATLARAVDFTVDPRRLAHGLSQVSLLDILGDEQLAGLFAVGLELGSLLSASERMTGWLDSAPGNAHRFTLNWTLPGPPAR